MSFIYLWRNREKNLIFSRLWIKQWAKRILSFPKLIAIINTKFSLRINGAKIDESVIVSNESKIEGCLNQLSIGKFTFIGKAYMSLHANVQIGSFVVINDGVKLLTASHAVDDPFWRSFAKPIIIDDYAWIATDAIILPGVHVGKGAIVGAGAVVSKNVPKYCIAVGNPAKLIEKKRVATLQYNPVHLVACYEAWLGKT